MIYRSDAAFIHAKDVLMLNGFKIGMVNRLNHNRHELVKCLDDKGRISYFYLVFKHTFMHSFNSLAKDFVSKNPEFAGQGESINVEYLEKARQFNAMLLYVYESGAIYMVHSITLSKFVHEHQLIREQERENAYVEEHQGTLLNIVKNEKTAYFPVKLFERYY